MRSVMAGLWQFAPWRSLVHALILRGVFAVWLFRNTPYGYALKLSMLEIGEFGLAAEAQRLLDGSK